MIEARTKGGGGGGFGPPKSMFTTGGAREDTLRSEISESFDDDRSGLPA